MGSDNGGIVINLGTGGVSFQAAMRLTAKKDSTLNVQLRGSGLNVELVGEIVWLGASQKEAGICFKHPSTKQQQDIASWIVRQQQPRSAISYGERPWQELPPAVPFQPGTPGPLGSHSLAAALGMSHTMPADAPSRINPDADPDDSLVSALLDPDGELPGVMPRLEIPPQESPALDSVPQLAQLNARSFTSPAPAKPAPLLPTASISEGAPVEPPVPSPIEDSARVVKALPQAAAQARSETRSSGPEAGKLATTKTGRVAERFRAQRPLEQRFRSGALDSSSGAQDLETRGIPP